MWMPKRIAHQRGLTMVETIVAILLIASCAIGIAAIYAQRQNIARGGRLHERAVELAQEIAGHIRQDANIQNNFETTLGVTCNPEISASGNATNLVACWQDTVEQDLTNGSARIALDRNTVPAQYVIVVSWSEPRSGTASYVVRVTPGPAPAPAANTIDSGAVRAAG
jgi:type II secretory pathway pseudopilin PulG